MMALPQLPPIPQRLRKPLSYAGYGALALVVIWVTLFASLPRDRIRERLESQLSLDSLSGQPLALGMDVTIGDVGLTIFSGAGLSLKDIVLRTRPQNPSEKPVRYLIDDVTTHFGLLGLLFNRPSYSFRGHLLQGMAKGQLAFSPEENRIRVEASGLVLDGVPGIQAAVGLPVGGTVSGKMDLTEPKALLLNSGGSIELSVDDLFIGDGKAKLVVPNDPFLSQGVTVPRIKLGKLAGQIVVEKGRGRFEGIRVHSTDCDVALEGYIELRDPITMSTIHGYLRFRPSDALLQREPTVELLNNAMSIAKRADGYLGFSLTGTIGMLMAFPSKDPPPGVTSPPDTPLAGASAPTHVLHPPSFGGGARMAAPPYMPPAPSEQPQMVPPQPQPEPPPQPAAVAVPVPSTAAPGPSVAPPLGSRSGPGSGPTGSAPMGRFEEGRPSEAPPPSPPPEGVVAPSP